MNNDPVKIGLFDPGIENNEGSSSTNLGDLIIQGAVQRELNRIFSKAEITRISTQVPIPEEKYPELRKCRHLIVGGTNLLSSFMGKYKQWKITAKDAWRIRRARLMGVGWWQYQDAPDRPTWFTLMGALSWRGLHSTRDEYTRQKLLAMGLRNVVNTGCPTMWPFLEFDQSSVPTTKAEDALLMLTDYRSKRSVEPDSALVRVVLENYRNVYFWPQGRRDLDYMDKLGFPVIRLEHSMASLNEFLRTGPRVDYIGTRLHGGVHCLLAGKRSLIMEVDNRSAEISRDTGLPTAKPDDMEAVRRWIQGPTPLNIRMNGEAINRWRAQFI